MENKPLGKTVNGIKGLGKVVGNAKIQSLPRKRKARLLCGLLEVKMPIRSFFIIII